ncbi:MAG: hypothetical protein ACLP53_22080 [Isosphaeraceae bacterium]
MRYHSCKHCGQSTELDFSACGHCTPLRAGCWVSTPDGSGEIVQVRHSGGLVVLLKDGRTRQYRGDLLMLIEPPPAPIITQPQPAPIPQPVPEREPLITADRTSDCPQFSRDTDGLASIRRALLSRSFGPLAFAESRR